MLQLIYCLCLLFPVIYGSECCDENTCLFQDSSGSGQVLDLSAFSCRTLDFRQNDYQYLYTPCGDRDSCQSNQDTVTAMMVQSDPKKNFCARIANWDEFESQPSFDGKEWKLEYANGEECFDQPRLFTTVWRCSESEHDVRVQEVTEPVPCHYGKKYIYIAIIIIICTLSLFVYDILSDDIIYKICMQWKELFKTKLFISIRGINIKYRMDIYHNINCYYIRLLCLRIYFHGNGKE